MADDLPSAAGGIWEWDPISKQDWIDSELRAVVRAAAAVESELQDGSKGLLCSLVTAESMRLISAATHAWQSGGRLLETVELRGQCGWKLRLQGGRSPAGSERIFALCTLELPISAPQPERDFDLTSTPIEVQQFLLDNLIHAPPLLIVVIDRQGELQFVNRPVEELLGFSLTELKHKDWLSEFLEPAERARIEAAMAATLRGEVPEQAFQTRVKSRHNGVRVIEWSDRLTPKFGSDSKFLFGVGLDVTERKQQQAALLASQASLQQSNSRLQAIFESSPECIKVVDENCRLIDMNAAGIRGLEVDSLEQIQGADVRQWIAPEYREQFQKSVRAACAGQPTIVEFQLIGSAGTKRWMEQHAVGFSSANPKDQPRRMVAVTRDITEQRRIQSTLRESEQHYRQLFEMMTEGFALHEIVLDADGKPADYRYLEVNAAFESLMELKRADVLGRCHSEFPSSDRNFWINAYGEVALTGRPLRMEYVNPESQRHWIVLAYRTQPLQFAVLFSEITEWRKAEREQRTAHDNLMMIINKAPLVWFALDREGRFTASQGKALAKVGLRPGELVGKSIFEIYADWTETMDAVRQALAGESASFSVQVPGIAAFEQHYEPIRDYAGRIVGMSGLAIDVTEQVAAQAALRESEERLRLLVEYAPVGIAMMDRDLKYIAYSQRWSSDYQLGNQSLVGRSHYEVFPETPERWREIHRRCLLGAVERCERDMFERVDGSVAYLRWEIQPWRDSSGEIGGVVFFTENITKSVLAEEEVQSLRNQVAHAGRIATMGEMAAGIAHELNQPLAAIGLYAEGCLSAAPSGQLTQVEFVQKFAEIAALANRCGEIIRRLRQFATKRVLQKLTVDVREILTASSDFLKHEFRNGGVRLRLTLPSSPLTVLADSIQLQQVFINIIRNALEATMARPTGEQQVEITAALLPPHQVRVTIRDFGAGISPEQMTQLFTPFFTTKASGLGMGLKISATIVRAHRGEIHCTSTAEGGTEFAIHLPATSLNPTADS